VELSRNISKLIYSVYPFRARLRRYNFVTFGYITIDINTPIRVASVTLNKFLTSKYSMYKLGHCILMLQQNMNKKTERKTERIVS